MFLTQLWKLPCQFVISRRHFFFRCVTSKMEFYWVTHTCHWNFISLFFRGDLILEIATANNLQRPFVRQTKAMQKSTHPKKREYKICWDHNVVLVKMQEWWKKGSQGVIWETERERDFYVIYCHLLSLHV